MITRQEIRFGGCGKLMDDLIDVCKERISEATEEMTVNYLRSIKEYLEMLYYAPLYTSYLEDAMVEAQEVLMNDPSDEDLYELMVTLSEAGIKLGCDLRD